MYSPRQGPRFFLVVLVFLEITSCRHSIAESSVDSALGLGLVAKSSTTEINHEVVKNITQTQTPSKPAVGSSSKSSIGVTSIVKTGTAFIPSKPFDGNYTGNVPSLESENQSLPVDDDSTGIPGQPKFDDKAAGRALAVIAAIAFLLLIYLGIKFLLLKKKNATKQNKNYGRIESEMDLLDEMEDGGDTDEEEELFDVNAMRRSKY